MRIAFLNVWATESAETHAGHMLGEVARRTGHEIIPCRNAAEVEACAADFAVVISRTQARLTRCPAYACVNEPSTVYMREPKLLQYFFTFDGYVALADSLTAFTRHALAGIGRREDVGVYYNTAQRQDVSDEAVRAALMGGAPKVTYFGTNWDGRRFGFFRQLGAWDGAEIYGPEKNWRQFAIPQYRGEVPFDGVSNQRIYQKNGVGLNILGDHHLHEDVISNRVFEIASVGAVCISCRMPWLEKHFGDTFYYIEQESTNASLFAQVRARLDEIRANPAEAFARAQEARRIFEEKFTLEKLVENLVAYHKAKSAPQSRADDPLISVLVKSGGRADSLARALQSIAAQERGRFQILVVAQGGTPLPALAAPHLSLERVEGDSYWQAFPAIRGEWVAFLEEEQEWFPQHIGRQLAMRQAGSFLHGAQVDEHDGVAPEMAWVGNDETRGISCQLDVKDHDPQQALGLICFSSLLAPAALVAELAALPPPPAALEEKDIVLGLLARARPRQTFSATVLHRMAASPASRKADALEQSWLYMRHWRDLPHTEKPNRLWDRMVDSGVRARAYRFETERRMDGDVTVDALKHCRFDRSRLRPIPLPWVKEQSFFRMGLTLTNEAAMAMDIKSGEGMQGVAGFIAFPQDEAGPAPQEYLLVLELEVTRGQLAVQMLQNARTLERYHVGRPFPAGRRYRFEIPVYYRPEVNGLVIELLPHTEAKITGLAAYSEEPETVL